MEAGTPATASTRGASRMFRTLQQVEPRRATEEAAYDKWLDQTSDREEARQDRIHGAAGRDPDPALDRALPHRRRDLRASCSSSPTAANGRGRRRC